MEPNDKGNRVGTLTREEALEERAEQAIAAMKSELADAYDTISAVRRRNEQLREVITGWKERDSAKSKELSEALKEIERLNAESSQSPPFSAVLEREFIGGLLMWNQEARALLKAMSKHDFFDPWYSFLFGQLRLASAAGVPIVSNASVTEWLFAKGRIREKAKAACLPGDQASICVALADLMNHASASKETLWHAAKRLRQLRKKRAAVYVTCELVKSAGDYTEDVAAWIASAKEQIGRVEGISEIEKPKVP